MGEGGNLWFQEFQKVEEVKMTANPASSVDGRTDSQSGQRHFPKGNSREAVHCATCQATCIWIWRSTECEDYWHTTNVNVWNEQQIEQIL